MRIAIHNVGTKYDIYSLINEIVVHAGGLDGCMGAFREVFRAWANENAFLQDKDL